MWRALITRPAAQADEWVIGLRTEGIDAVALPLIGIEALRDPQPLAEAWHGLAQRDLVMFVSPNAVHYFFAARPAGMGWPERVWAAAPGPGTAAALRAQGVARIVEPSSEAVNFDSEALWTALFPRGPWRSRSVLILRGSDGDGEGGGGAGREWLVSTLRKEGATVDLLASYRRGAPRWDVAQQGVWAQALALPQAHVWCFSSSEAIANLQVCAGDVTAWRASVALATHPRIAAAARKAGFTQVHELAPTLDALAATLRSLQGSSIQSAPS